MRRSLIRLLLVGYLWLGFQTDSDIGGNLRLSSEVWRWGTSCSGSGELTTAALLNTAAVPLPLDHCEYCKDSAVACCSTVHMHLQGNQSSEFVPLVPSHSRLLTTSHFQQVSPKSGLQWHNGPAKLQACMGRYGPCSLHLCTVGPARHARAEAGIGTTGRDSTAPHWHGSPAD